MKFVDDLELIFYLCRMLFSLYDVDILKIINSNTKLEWSESHRFMIKLDNFIWTYIGKSTLYSYVVKIEGMLDLNINIKTRITNEKFHR